VDDYIQSIENEVFPIEKGYNLTFNDQIIRECINEFMCNRKLIFAEIAERLNTSAEMVKNAIILDAEVLDEFTRDNIIRYNKDEIELTENGLLFIRNVAASLDPLMKYNSKTYSGTI
jgi:oxygen-independent coproporphyrinogen-3 oxidase